MIFQTSTNMFHVNPQGCIFMWILCTDYIWLLYIVQIYWQPEAIISVKNKAEKPPSWHHGDERCGPILSTGEPLHHSITQRIPTPHAFWVALAITCVSLLGGTPPQQTERNCKMSFKFRSCCNKSCPLKLKVGTQGFECLKQKAKTM